MNKKYSQEDIRKGFQNLARLKKHTVSLEKEVAELRQEVARYHAKEVGEEMLKLGFNNAEANAAISMLKRLIPG